jgi:CheY-like chemotaxis protein
LTIWINSPGWLFAKILSATEKSYFHGNRSCAVRDRDSVRHLCGSVGLDAGIPSYGSVELLGGFEVLAANDSESGCKLAVNEHPDLILMDLEMPVLDRWEPVRRLRNDPQTQDIPIIGISAHALEIEREQAIAVGCDEFDAKPIEFESLAATVRRVLAHPN